MYATHGDSAYSSLVTWREIRFIRVLTFKLVIYYSDGAKFVHGYQYVIAAMYIQSASIKVCNKIELIWE